MIYSENPKDDLFKIMLYGAQSSGKTCFFQTITHSLFQLTHIPTDHVEIAYRCVSLQNGETVNLQLWDTPGESNARSISYNYMSSANGALIFYDITSKESFEDAKSVYRSIRRKKKVPILFVGNKTDLSNEKREVKTEDVTEFCKKRENIGNVEVSVKTRENLKMALVGLVVKSICEGNDMNLLNENKVKRSSSGEMKIKEGINIQISETRNKSSHTFDI